MAKFIIEKWQFNINRTKFAEILKAVQDLNKISPMVKIKMDESDVLFYARAGNDVTIPAFKSFQYSIQDWAQTEEVIKMDFIILNAVNWVKNCQLLLNSDTDIICQLQYHSGSRVAQTMYISNGKLTLNFVSGDYTQIKDITKEQIAERMDPSLCNFSFNMTGDQFAEIKKLSALNKSDTISLRCKNGQLQFYDKRWQVTIEKTGEPDDSWTFANKYLKSIESEDQITINMFDHFLLIKERNTNLLIGLELNNIK